MSDNIIQITEPESYSLEINTDSVHNTNVTVEVSGNNVVDVLSNQIVFVKDLPEGYPISWTIGNLPVSRLSGIVGQSGVYYSNGYIGLSGIPYNLIPVHNIISGSGINVTSNSGIFNVAVTGQFGLTGEQVDDRISNLLVAGSYTQLNYNDNNDQLTISVTGLQPSGNYSLVGHTHSSSEIIDFNSSVSGLLPSISGSGYVNSSFNNNIYTISVSGLQPSGNYSLVGHTHNSSEIIDFESSVNALIPTNIVHTTGNQTIDGIKTFTDNIFINDLLVSVKPISESIVLISSDTQLSAHRFKIIYISNYGDLNSYTITLPNDSSPGDCIILIFVTAISDITVRRRNHNGSGYGPMYTTMGFVRGDISPINRSYIYYSDSNNFISAGFYRPWINIPSSEHNHGNITDHGEIGSVSGLLVITSDNGLLTTTSGINSNYITNFESAVNNLIPPSNFTSLSGVSGIIVTNSGTNYFVGLNDPSIQLADITDLSANARTFLLTSFSDNLRTLIGDETGSGVLVFNNSPAFSGTPTAPTAPSGTNTTQIASTAFVRNEISNLVDSAPSTLDTLNELAAALGDDPNFATTIASGLAGKASLVHSHSSSDITNFNSSVSGLLPVTNITGSSGIVVNNSGTTYNVRSSGLAFTSGANFSSLSVTGVPVSVSGHSHITNDITDFYSSVSGIVNSGISTSLVAGTGISLDYYSNNDTLMISTSGVSLVGHKHVASEINDFNSAVKLIKLNDFAVPTGTVNFNNQRLINVGVALSGTDGINKNYIDNLLATTGIKGIASFDSGDFSVTSGVVSIKTSGIDNSQLVYSNLVLGSTTLTLGSSYLSINGLTIDGGSP